VPATYSAAVPAVYGDTRTGGSGSVKSSGALGFNVTAGANGGGVAVTLPYQTTLVLPDKFVAGQVLHVGGSGSIAAGANIAVDAPSFNAAVNGVINTTTTLTGKGCFVGAGCAAGSTQTHINQTFEIVSFDTARNPAAQALDGLVPLPVKLGEELPITVGAQTVGHVTINAPSDRAGGTVAGKKLTFNTSDTLLHTTADFGGIAQVALGEPSDVLQPAMEIPQAIAIGGTVVNLQGGVKLGLSQHLAFEANVDVTLTFDQIAYDSQGVALGTSVTFDIGSGLDIQFKKQPGRLSYSFSMGDDSLLSNDTGLSVDPLFAIKAGCFSLSVAGGALADVSQCAFDREYATTDLMRATVYDKSFALQGFNEASYSVDLAPVPEPQTWALLLAGLGMVGALARRRVTHG
jgi:hypothetical protein